jgi:hypothetical protein
MPVRKTSLLQRAREAAARELGLPTTDWRVVRLATLTAAHEALQAALASGLRVDFKDLLEVDRALADLRKELKTAAPIDLKVSFVDSARGKFKCTKCGELNEVRDDAPAAETPVQPAAPVKAPGTTDIVPGAAKITDHGKMHRPTVVPITAEQRRAEALAAAPLKKYQGEAWHAYAHQIPTV